MSLVFILALLVVVPVCIARSKRHHPPTAEHETLESLLSKRH